MGTMVFTGNVLNYRGETVVNSGVLVLDGTNNVGGSSTLSGNLQNTPVITVNGGTLLLRNGVRLSRAERTASVGDTTSGLIFSANSGGNVDLTQVLNYEVLIGEDYFQRYQIPQGVSLTATAAPIEGRAVG